DCRYRYGDSFRGWRLQRRKPPVPAEAEGMWEGLAREGGLVETWHFHGANGRWTVAGRWLKDGQEGGLFHGESGVVNQDLLQFTVKADKLPFDGFAGDKLRYSALQADGDVLSYEYVGGARELGKGVSAMTRLEGKPTGVPAVRGKASYDNATVLKAVAPA